MDVVTDTVNSMYYTYTYVHVPQLKLFTLILPNKLKIFFKDFALMVWRTNKYTQANWSSSTLHFGDISKSNIKVGKLQTNKFLHFTPKS